MSTPFVSWTSGPFSVTWNGSLTFNLWLTGDPENHIDCRTSAEEITLEQAQCFAHQWLAEVASGDWELPEEAWEPIAEHAMTRVHEEMVETLKRVLDEYPDPPDMRAARVLERHGQVISV